MTSTSPAGTRFYGFASTFWIANTLELFERLAFYAAKAVMAVYLINKVGLTNGATLTGFFGMIVFGFPVVAGVFVDKYGFRRTLMACFLIFCVGYFLIGMAGMSFGEQIVSAIGKQTYVIIVLCLTALGGSLIKPCIVGTVANTTTPDNKALGFSIYYMLVNVGGAAGPMAALLMRERFGIEYVLVLSSITSGLLLVGTMIFFKEPAEIEGKKTFAKVFGDMLLVFRNFRFMSFLVIFSGFWIMFWQIFYSFPFYVSEVLKFERFEVMEAIDALGIIILTVPITALTKKLKPLTAMTIGMLVAAIAWVVIGAGLTLTAAIIGIGIYSIGEATQSPRFYEYVSNLAPKGQVGTFMGFAFLPIAIGTLLAGILADFLRTHYLKTDPSMMWYITASVGFVCSILMVVYNLIFGQQKQTEAK